MTPVGIEHATQSRRMDHRRAGRPNKNHQETSQAEVYKTDKEIEFYVTQGEEGTQRDSRCRPSNSTASRWV